MKKIILITLSLFAISAASLSAQDMAAATETYNNGATALNMGDNEGALQYFRDALTMAEACGEEGADIVANCKSYIPVIALSIAKGEIKAGDYDGAVAGLEEAIKIAGEYENADVAAEASDLIPQVYLQKGNTLLKAKDFAGAAASYQKSVEIDSTNGMACIRLGQALAATGNVNGAVEAYTINGNNYFKLRDIAALVDFGVTWNNATRTVEIDTGSPYEKPEQTVEQPASDAEDSNTPVDMYAIREEIVQLTNDLRRENGLPALAMDDDLMAAAQVRAEELEEDLRDLIEEGEQ